MEYNRDVVIDKINDLKRKSGKWGSGKRITNKVIAKHLGMSERQISDYLQKRPDYISETDGGYPDFPLKCLVELSNLFKCDINYLLDKDMTCKTKESTDICKVTGLSEEAVNDLANGNPFTKPYRQELASEFILFLDQYGSFAWHMLNYFIEKKRSDQYKDSKWFKPIVDIYESIDIAYPDSTDILYYENFLNENIKGIQHVLREAGKTEEEMHIIARETDGFFNKYFRFMALKNYILSDIQNEIVRFLDDYNLDGKVD